MALDPYWNNVVLAMTMDDPALGDATGKVSTKAGNAARSATQSKYGGYSAVFDGTGDKVSFPASADFALSGDFTVECWIRAAANNAAIIDIRSGASDAGVFIINSSGKIGYYDATSGALAGTTTISLNTWTHLAWVKSGSTFKMFVDGVQDYSASPTMASFGTSRACVVGLDYAGSSGFNGYIDDVRITKGVARYTGAFTPPTAIQDTFPTPYAGYDAYTKALLMFEGGSINDSMGNVVTQTGLTYTTGTAGDTTKYGTGSIFKAFLSSGQKLTVAGSGLSYGATDEVTLEGWFRVNTVGGNAADAPCLIDAMGLVLWCRQPNGSQCYLQTNGVDFGARAAGTPIVANNGVWHHAAAVRKNGTMYLFLNGLLEGTATSANTTASSSTTWWLCNHSAAEAAAATYFDEFRVSIGPAGSGAARYIANFTPPSSFSSLLPGRASNVNQIRHRIAGPRHPVHMR